MGGLKLSTLIQKRLAAINAGARALVDIDTSDKMEVVVQEILQDKIYLDAANEVKVSAEPTEPTGGPPELDLLGALSRRTAPATQRLQHSARNTASPAMSREIIVGVTGGVAAYKTAALVSDLVQSGYGVTTVMTRSARRFVGPATFSRPHGSACRGAVVRSQIVPARGPYRDRPPSGPVVRCAGYGQFSRQGCARPGGRPAQHVAALILPVR